MEKVVESLYFNNHCRQNKFDAMDTCYLFTNENMNGYIENLEKKEILAVAGSGDFYFNALLYGAAFVDLFDVNYLSKFPISLKKCCIEQLEYEDFLDFLGLHDKKDVLSYSIFKNLCNFDDESYTFYKNLYDLVSHDGRAIYESKLIAHFDGSEKEIMEANPYLIKENYDKLRKILLEKDAVSFLHTDINTLRDQLNKKYDIMYFSNINIYQRNTIYLKQIKRLSKFLKEDGVIYFAYLHNYSHQPQSLFYDNLLKSHKYMGKVLSWETTDRKDKVYIYKKHSGSICHGDLKEEFEK